MKIRRGYVIVIIPLQFAELRERQLLYIYCTVQYIHCACTHTLNKIRDGIKFEQRGERRLKKVEIKQM